jgi:uncharacterized protein DUF3520/protein with von Willebrand factor-like domain
MNADDPKLTAYALDELDELERQAIARALKRSPEAEREIQETQTMARLLRAAFADDLENPADATTKPLSANLNDIRDDPWFWTRARPLAIAAVLAVFAVIGLALFSSYQFRQHQIAQAGRRVADLASKSGTIDAEFEAAPATPSYAIVRRFINDDGVLPPKDSVRIEEMINYFTYAYPEPTPEQLLSLDIEVASCPWADSHRLVRVGLKGRERANSEAHTGEAPTQPLKIAREVSIQVEFNPAKVASYHLIGYEPEMPGKEGSNRTEIGMGEIDAGQTVTAFFEVVPAGTSENAAAVVLPLDSRKISAQQSNEMLTAKLRYKKPNNDKSELIQRSARDEGKQFASASPDFKFAAAVAEFGMLLRESEFKGNGTLGAVLEWAEEGKGADANGFRAAFLELVRKAEVLKRG